VQSSPTLTYLGGPTALLEWHGLRLLTDPTFDPAGTTYDLPAYTLRKTQAPAMAAGELGRIDAVLLSHDHHFDNLDHAGRSLLGSAARVLTTAERAARLGAGAIGLEPWQQTELRSAGGETLRVTATPARHGPPQADRGPVIGFALGPGHRPQPVVYVSGDSVWYEGIEEVGQRFSVRLALLNVGAARVAAAGNRPLTFTAAEAVQVAGSMSDALIVPLHFEGWEHFTESLADVEAAFAAGGLTSRLLVPRPGVAIQLRLP
jgi:L-ascorbate metabolism protein UlaG (beta-lactamase superfamily)